MPGTAGVLEPLALDAAPLSGHRVVCPGEASCLAGLKPFHLAMGPWELPREEGRGEWSLPRLEGKGELSLARDKLSRSLPCVGGMGELQLRRA